MADSNFEYAVDADNRLITLRLLGNEPSAWYADRIIEAYSAVPELWLYSRLADHRKFQGFVTREDLERIAAVWADLTRGHDVSRIRVAFITRNVLLRARVAAHADLFPGELRQSFTSLDDAMRWMLERESVV